MYCEKCGTPADDNIDFCPQCGQSLAETAEISDKSRLIYSILALFCGELGVHNFYAGRKGVGLAQLLMSILSCCTLAPFMWIWAVIEALTVRVDGKGKTLQSNGYSVILVAVVAPVLLVILLGLTSCTAGMMLPALNQAREKARRVSCVSNLKQIGMALHFYANDYDGYLPPANNVAGLELLRETRFLEDAAVYVCPSTTTSTAGGSASLVGHCDYIYLGGLNLHAVEDEEYPVAFDAPGNHAGFINVLYSTGMVMGTQLERRATDLSDILKFLIDEADEDEVVEFLREKQNELLQGR